MESAELLRRSIFPSAQIRGRQEKPSKENREAGKELKKIQKDRQFKEVESRFDEEHNLWEVRYVNSQGAEHLINWELASTPEFRQLITKFKQD
jgi:DNA gyrase subunit B